MRFKINIIKEHKHKEICSGVNWRTPTECFSISDDKKVLRWNTKTKNYKVDVFKKFKVAPTTFDWLVSTRGQNYLLAVGFEDGSIRFITHTGVEEKHVPKAHKGALKWRSDGSALVTAGEDGCIKIWSKSGQPRSTLVEEKTPIYSVVWSPEGNKILYCCGQQIHIQPIQAGTKGVSWKAHEGIILQADWNPTNNMIISCGEDCRYKIFDEFGRTVYSSKAYEYVLTSISWAPNGQYFAIGSYDILRLCDKTGWTESFSQPLTGSIMSINWSQYGTMCAGAGGNGNVVFAQVVDKEISWKNWDVKLCENNKIFVTDLINGQKEELDFNDRVIHFGLQYENLIVVTPTQCYIYNTQVTILFLTFSLNQNWSSPQIFESKETVTMIIQSPNYFALVDVIQGILIYNYDGRQVSVTRIPGGKLEFLSRKKISLSQDLLAVIDQVNSKIIRLYDIQTGKEQTFSLDHGLEIVEVHLNRTKIASERKIAFVDNNRDLFINPGHKRKKLKLASMTDSVKWNDKNDVICAISDSRLVTWFYPNANEVDKQIMTMTKAVKESSDIGRMAQLLSFSSNQVCLRRADGGKVNLIVSPYPFMLFDFCEKQEWEKAIRLARFVKEKTLWACLSAVSLYSHQLDTAEIALAAIELIDKVQYINYIRELPNEAAQKAALLLFFQKYEEAEKTLVKSNEYFRAIMLNIDIFRWERAIQIAKKYDTDIDTVLAYRKKYLEQANKEEDSTYFEEYKDKMKTLKANEIVKAAKLKLNPPKT